MQLQTLRIIQFKNYSEAQFSFVSGINCFLGENGSGKTNLLDAIHYLALAKSAFNTIDKDNIQHEERFFSLKGAFHKNDKKYELLCAVQVGEKKLLKNNNKPYDKLGEHVGLFPVVIITPQDTDIVKDSSESRRKFFDNLLCQINGSYLQNLVRYNHLLKQRNALLKRFLEQGNFDTSQVEPYDLHLVPLAIKIQEERSRLLQQFLPIFKHYYKALSDDKELVDIVYDTKVDGDFEQTINKSMQRDRMTGRTNRGIHRDDFVFEINGHPLKKFGSQGQQKSFVIALKLAQFDTLKQSKEIKPLLLLDDIFDKLDDGRIAYLLQLMQADNFGQIFLTDARPERTETYLEGIAIPKKFFTIHKGSLKKENESV